MGRTPKIILGMALLVLAFIWFFPSWLYVLDGADFSFRAKIGSSWLWAPPMPYGVTLDWTKNLSYSLAVVLVAGGLCLWSFLVDRT